MKKSNYEQHVSMSYSTAFKLKVVEEIESGKFSITEAGKFTILVAPIPLLDGWLNLARVIY